LGAGTRLDRDAPERLNRLGVPTAGVTRDASVTFLTKELGTDNIDRAKTCKLLNANCKMNSAFCI
jgi:hypothetical protein